MQPSLFRASCLSALKSQQQQFVMNSRIPSTLFKPSNVLCSLNAGSKKAFFEIAAKEIFKDASIDSWEALFDALIAREKVGTTGFGDGIAIPHCRLASCKKPTAFFAKLSKAIDFDAIDGQEVDLIFVLVVPEEANSEHLDILSVLAAILEKNAYRISLRDSQSDEELLNRLERMIQEQEQEQKE